MSAVAKERYRRYIRIGLHGSTNKLRVSIPDEFHYPHTTVYAKVDLLKREVLLIPYSVGHADAVLYNFLNDPHNPGSRYVDVSGPSHGLGQAFAIAPTLFEMNRETGLLKVAIPAAEDRSPPVLSIQRCLKVSDKFQQGRLLTSNLFNRLLLRKSLRPCRKAKTSVTPFRKLKCWLTCSVTQSSSIFRLTNCSK